jgi:hypothetical protein
MRREISSWRSQKTTIKIAIKTLKDPKIKKIQNHNQLKVIRKRSKLESP